MYQPSALKKGDRIGIVAPAGFIAEEKIKYAVEIIEGWGFPVVPGDNVFARYNQFAGDDERRGQDLQIMLDDPDVKAVICARGGYGSIRTLKYLDFNKFLKNPKWIVGYSDITVFHSYLNHVLGVESLHAAMPVNFSDAREAALDSLHESLTGNFPSYKLSPNLLNREGDSRGVLVGGNLSILYSLRGTYLDIDTKDKILFIEDIGEELYHLDRIMMNMKVGGVLENLKGLIVGGFTNMKAGDPCFGQTANEIIRSFVDDYDYPVVFDFPAGHISDNRALLMGHPLSLNVCQDHTHVGWP